MARPKVRPQLVNEIRMNFVEINERFKEGKNLPSFESYRSAFGKLTNTKNRNFIATGNLSKFNVAKLRDIKAFQEKFLADPRTDANKRKKIFKKSISKVKERYKNATETRYNRAIDILNSDAFSKIADRFSSEQVLELFFTTKKRQTTVERALLEVVNREDFDKLSSREISEDIYTKLGINEEI